MKIFLTGGGGFLGSYLLKQAPPGAQITASSFRTKLNLKECKSPIKQINLDLADESAVKRVLRQVKPDVILHAAAQANVEFCELHPESSSAVNVSPARIFSAYAQENEKSFCYLSTDLVFDGENAPYSASSPVHPVNVYGQQKVQGEIAATKATKGLVCRVPLLYGLHYNNSRGQLNYLLHQWQNGQPTPLFTDEHRTIAHAARVAAGIWLLIKTGQTGIWHLGGPERISRFDFAYIWAKLAGFQQDSGENSLLKASLQIDVQSIAKRAKDVSLNSEEAFQLGYIHPPHKMELRAILEELKKSGQG